MISILGNTCYHRKKHRVPREPGGKGPNPNLNGVRGGFPKEVTPKAGPKE